MANTTRKPLTFNVSTDTYNHFSSLFPHEKLEGKPDCSEANLLAVLESYEHPQASTSDEQQAHIDELQSANSELQAQVQHLTDMLSAAQGTAEQYAELQTAISEAEQDNERLAEQNSKLAQEKEHLQALLLDIQQADGDLAGITDEFTLELLQTVTERLRETTCTPTLTPMQVLLDSFLKYNVQQYNLWFYDFVVSKSEILRIANKHNPQIDSLKKLQMALGIYG